MASCGPQIASYIEKRLTQQQVRLVLSQGVPGL